MKLNSGWHDLVAYVSQFDIEDFKYISSSHFEIFKFDASAQQSDCVKTSMNRIIEH